jgi:hypothetical protein
MRCLLALLVLAAVPRSASGQDTGGIGYPTVEAALKALKARSDVQITNQGGWTIVNEVTGFWSFTPPGHPAHPAAVRRTIVSRDGVQSVEMRFLCEAGKEACDQLQAQFHKLNEKLLQAARSKDKESKDNKDKGPAQWRGSADQERQVERRTYGYFAARDGGKYEDAYALLSPWMKKSISYEQWRVQAERFNVRAGAVKSRRIARISWYKDPPNTAPGMYAAVDFVSEFAQLGIHCGYLGWQLQDDGAFLLVHEEENYIERSVQEKLSPEELAKMRAKFRC